MAANTLYADDDIAIVERRSVSTTATLGGRYSLADKRDKRGQRREFACRTEKLSPDSITVSAPFCGAIGGRVIAFFDEIGRLDGQILRRTPYGFVMSILMPDERRARLAAKIDWLDKHKHHRLPDDRRHRRMIPEQPHSTLLLADGSTLSCFVIDMSVSGAAVSADITPQIGDVLAVGKIIGRVVRVFPEGFALRFITLQAEANLERWLIRK